MLHTTDRVQFAGHFRNLCLAACACMTRVFEARDVKGWHARKEHVTQRSALFKVHSQPALDVLHKALYAAQCPVAKICKSALD